MDNLSVAFLVFLFMFSGSGLTTAVFLTMLLTKFADLTCFTLFSFSVLSVYFIYGFAGLLFIMLSTFTVITSGLMFWFDVSLLEMQDKMTKELKLQNKLNDLDDNVEKLTLVEQKFAELENYKLQTLNVFYKKTGLDDKKVAKLLENYKSLSMNFDNLVNVVYEYLLTFRKATENTVGLKELYKYCDYVLIVKNGIINARTLHRMSREVQNPTLSNNTNNNNDPFSMLGNFGNLGDLSQLNKQVEKELLNMSPAQKKQMDDMAKQMFGNINMDDMMGMFGNISNNTNKKNKKSKKNK